MNRFVIAITLSCALLLTLLPMPDWVGWLRPVWVLLVLMYWTIMLPYRVNIGIAWLVGLMLDVLNGTLLGEHALAFTLIIYLVSRIHSRIRMSPMLQQGLTIGLFIVGYQFILFCIQGATGDLPRRWMYWLPALTSMLLWPWLFTILQDCRRRFRVV